MATGPQHTAVVANLYLVSAAIILHTASTHECSAIQPSPPTHTHINLYTQQLSHTSTCSDIITSAASHTSYYNARGLLVCLFLIQIARCAAKHAMPTEGRMGCSLTGPVCNYLPCGRKTCEVFLSRGTEMPFLIAIIRLLSREGTP